MHSLILDQLCSFVYPFVFASLESRPFHHPLIFLLAEREARRLRRNTTDPSKRRNCRHLFPIAAHLSTSPATKLGVMDLMSILFLPRDLDTPCSFDCEILEHALPARPDVTNLLSIYPCLVHGQRPGPQCRLNFRSALKSEPLLTIPPVCTMLPRKDLEPISLSPSCNLDK